ncbi:MAG: PAS domain-containing protein [Nitrospirales bacterium]
MSIQYTIDSADHIRFINEAWLQFACQNDGAHLNRAFVIGKSLWDFIDGEDLRHLYAQIFKMVRTKHHTMVFRFRCDSPVCRRYFLMTLSPLLEGSLMLSTHPIREELREPVALLDPDVQRGEPLLRMCSWCIKACLPTEEWVELEEAIKRMDLLGGAEMPRLTHGICQECERTINLELKSLV